MTRLALVADCGRCDALCCVAPPFDASDDFALSKPAGERCPHLTDANRCRVHAELAASGFPGCVAFDCHGAGQRATERFRSAPERLRHDAFMALVHVHELVWLVDGALRFCPPNREALRVDLARELESLETLADLDAASLVETNLAPREASVRALLGRLRGQ